MTQLFFYHLISLFTLAISQESIRFATTGCNPQLQDCEKNEGNCVDVAPTNMTLTCKQIVDNQLCSFLDRLSRITAQGGYCKVSCGTCGKCNTTMLGCQCQEDWTFGQEKFQGCANPDDDKFGSWCAIIPDSCVGLSNTSYQIKKYDYCSKECSQEYKIIPTSANSTQNLDVAATASATSCTQVYSGETSPKIPGKPNVKITVVGSRVFVITNFEQETVSMEGWKILDGVPSTQLEFSSRCAGTANYTIPAQENIYFKYGIGSCAVSTPVSYTKYLRLVDRDERVISNVNIQGITADQVICYQNGKHDLVNILECKWW
eukprot:TRINITY_DN8727_c0_g1_i3.p2 TRINITY_DN8727_c0_g1~~TRINITY_DN8727_c0_g1_i3.p2  ORF type:complete len:318 (-),score=13.91 TRINITY_DN8727_c0_g1_i3:31-984(-)